MVAFDLEVARSKFCPEAFHRQPPLGDYGYNAHGGEGLMTSTLAESMKFTSVGESLRRHWLSHHIEINAGVSEAELEAFEEKFGVILPTDFREYFRCVNGMPTDVVDDGMIRFWMIEEIKPLTQGAPAYSASSYVENSQSLFLFADYSMWAHAYAIRLASIPVQSNEVIIIGYKSPVLISHSFSEFGHHYLTAKDLLH